MKNVISSVVVNVESLATVVAATVDGDNETSKSFSSGNISKCSGNKTHSLIFCIM